MLIREHEERGWGGGVIISVVYYVGKGDALILAGR